MTTTRNLAKVFVKVNLKDQKGDFAYWQTQSYETRLTALEQIRREYHSWKYGAEPRFQRPWKSQEE